MAAGVSATGLKPFRMGVSVEDWYDGEGFKDTGDDGLGK